MSKNKSTAAIGFIFVTLLIDITGIGIIIPVLPKLLEQLLHTDSISQISRYGGFLMFAYAVMQFLFAPLIGSLSDRYGRRPVLLFSLFGFGIDYIFMAFAPSIIWLFAGRIVAGILGGSITTATAYIADISSEKDRAQNFGLIGAAFGIGFILGPVIGGLLGTFGTQYPFLFAALLALVNCLYGYFVLPESLSLENRRKFEWKRANPIGVLYQLKKYPVISGFIISIILIYIAGQATQSVWTYYTIERFQWNATWIGYSLGFVGLTVAIVQGGLIRIIVPKLGQKNSIFIGLGLYALGFLLFAFANNGWMMFAFMIPYAMGGIAVPTMQALMSSQVPANEQGELQGALTSLISITSIIGPLVMTNLFAYYTSEASSIYLPGAPFLLGSILSLGSMFFAIRTLAVNNIGKK